MAGKDRQSSIAFAYTNERHFDTECKSKYVNHGALSADDVQAFQQNKQYLRGTHFELGVSATDYGTTQKEGLPAHHGHEVTAPFSQARGSNFQLGYQGEDSGHYVTTCQRDMAEPGMTEHYVASKPGPGHGISFGTDNGVYESQYQAQCRTSQTTDPNDDGVKLVNASERTKELRKSNFVLGTDKPQYVSNAQEGFCYKGCEAPVIATNTDIRKQHIHLGSEQVQYASTAAADYGNYDKIVESCTKPVTLDTAQKADLRTHHFSFGNDNTSHRTLSQDTFSGPNRGPNANADAARLQSEIADVRASMRKSNIALGCGAISQWESTAKGTFDTKDLQAAKGDRVEPDRKSNITFGHDSEECKRARVISVGHQDMQLGVEGSTYRNEKVVANARQTSICIGMETGTGQSTAQASYVHHKDAVSAAMSKDVLKDLRATHYQLGTDTTGYKGIQTAMQEQMQFRQPDITDKPFKKEEDARKACISFGNQNVQYVSTAQQSYMWPEGKQP